MEQEEIKSDNSKSENGDIKPKGDNCGISLSTFVLALAAVLLGAVLVNLWIRVINNLAYNLLGYNPDSFWVALIVALLATGVLVAYIFIAFDDDHGNQLKAQLTGLGFVSVNTSNFSPGDIGDTGDSHDHNNM